MYIDEDIIKETPCPNCGETNLRIAYGLNKTPLNEVICKSCRKVYSSNEEELKYKYTLRPPITRKELAKSMLSKKANISNLSIQCPYCNSTNTIKISGSSKVVRFAFLGLFSLGKISKQWHCNNCNSDF